MTKKPLAQPKKLRQERQKIGRGEAAGENPCDSPIPANISPVGATDLNREALGEMMKRVLHEVQFAVPTAAPLDPMSHPSPTTKCSGRWCSTSHEVACGAVRQHHSTQF